MPHADEKVAIPPSVIGEFQVDGSKPRGTGVPWNRHAGGKMLVGLPEVRRKAVGSVHDTVTQRILKANGVTKITKKAKEKKAVVIPPGPGMLVAPGAPPAAVAAPPAQPPPTLAGLPAGVGRQKPPTLAPAIEVEDTRTGGCCGLFGGRAPPPRSPALADIKGDTGGGAGPGAGSGGSALGSGAAGSSTSPAGAAARPITASSRGAPSLYDSTFRQANQSIKRGPQSARTRSGGARARSAGSEGGVSNWGDVEEGEFEELQELDEDDEDDLLDDHDPREDEVTALGPGSSRQTTATGEGGEGLQATSVGPSRAGTAKSLALSTYTVASSKAPTKSILKSATSKREQSSNGGAGAHLAAVSVDGRVSNGGGAPGGATPSMRVSAGGGGANLLYGDVASSSGGGGGVVPPGYAPSASALRSDCLNPAVATRPPSELLFGSTPPMGAGLSFVTGGGGGGLFGAAFGGGGSGGGYAPPPAARLSGAGAGGSGSPMGGGAIAAADAAAMAPGAGAASLSAATAARPGNNMMVSAEQLLDMLMAQGKITEDDVQGVMGLGMQQQQHHQQHQPPAGSSLPPPPPQTPQLQAAASVAGAIGPNPFASGGSGSGGQPQTHSCPGHSSGHSATDVPQLMAGQPAPAAAASGAATGGAGPRAVAGPGPGSGLAAHGSLQRDSASRVRFGANQQLGQAPPPGSRQLTHSNSGGPGDLPPPVAPPPVAAHAVSESLMAASPSGDGGGGSAAVLAAAAALQGAAQGDLRVRFIDETGMRTGGDTGSEAGSPRVPHSPNKTPPEAMTAMEIGPGPGYNPQSLLSAASAALAQPLAASSAAGLPPSPPRAGPGGEGLAAAAAGLGHGGGGGARSTLSPYTAGSALLAGQPHQQPHPVSAGGAASAARDAHPLPPPLGLGGVGRAGDGTGVLQLRISGGLSPMPTHTHAYGHSSKAPAGFAAAAAAALASPSPPAQQVGHMVAQGVAPPQGPSPMRITTSGAYAGGPGGVGAGTGGAVLRHNISGGSGGSASIRVASAGSVASGSTTRSGYVSGQVTGAGGARDAAPAREPSAFGKKVSEAAAAAAAVAAAAGGSSGGGGGMGAVERLAALKLQSHMRGGASAGGASQDGTHGIPGLDGSRLRQPHAGAGSSSKPAGSRSGGGGGTGSSWMSDGGAGNAYHQSRAQAAPQQQHQQQQHQQGPQAPAPSRPNGGRSVRWTAAVVYEIDPGEVEDVAGRGSNQNAKGGAGGQAAAAGGRGGGASAAADGGGGRGGGWI